MQAWVDAYATGDAKAACALQTDAFTAADLTESDGEATTCEEGVVVAQQMMKDFGVDMSSAKAELVSKDDDTAKVMLTVDGQDPTTYGMVLVDGTWMVDSEQ